MSNEVLSIDIFEKHYELPKDIITYIEEHHRFEVYRQELQAYFMDAFSDYQNFPHDSERVSYEKFRHYGNLCALSLIANGIYDVTADELVGRTPEKYTWGTCSDASTNEGVKMFYEAFRDAVLEQANALIAKIDSLMGQAQQAEAERDSKITGSGVTIYTNSIIGAGVWAAMEKSTIKKQASAANAQFHNDIDTIERNLDRNMQDRLDKYDKEVWVPALKNSIDLFVMSLFNKYIEVLVSHEQFNPEALNYFDLEKSNSILKNIGATSNKFGILDAAFLSCPFNPEIYDTAIGVCDDVEEVVNCAKVFGLDEYLKSKNAGTCNEIAVSPYYNESEIIEKIAPHISVVALLNGKTPEEVQEEAVSTHRRLINDKISKMASEMQCASESEVKAFIKSIINTPIDELVGVSDEKLREYIVSKVTGDIIRKDNPELYESTILQTVETITPIIQDYLSKVSMAKAEYLSKKAECDAHSLSAEKELRRLNELLDSLGVFAFSQKKDTTARIAYIQRRCNTFEVAAKDAEKAYLNLI